MRRAFPVLLAIVFSSFGCGSSPGVAPDGGDMGGDMAVGAGCGNGVLDPGEECDDGNTVNGDGCQADCTYTCNGNDGKCDDLDPCNGTETCTPQHTCQPGTPLADGASCGTGLVCKNQTCLTASCGDGIVTAPEECDDGNSVNGDGCDNDCRFSCVSTDSTRNCTPTDACMGQGTCNDTTHTCTAGTPVADDMPCPQNAKDYCKGGVCTAPVCGNDIVEPGEQCDDGNTTSGDGCEPVTCTYSCSNPATDCPAAPACEKETCDASHKCAAVADASQNGKSCGTGSMDVCQNGACLPPGSTCGNGIKESGEDCDLGTANNLAGSGCQPNCTFSCTLSPNSCDDGNPCNGTETCATGMATSSTGTSETIQKCQAGTALTDGTACGTGDICLGGTCKTSTCGDGYVDKTNGEECDPPNGTTCSSKCLTIQCGNGRRDPGEQCDDGNTTNLDGCDSKCQFEQDARVDSLQMQFATDSYCTANALGGAIAVTQAQTTLQMSLDSGVADGSISILLKMLGLDDLQGKADAAVTLGVMSGTPATSSNTTYDGTNDVDWWYTADTTGLDAQRNPTALLPGSIASQLISAGPGSVTLNLILSGTSASLHLSNTKVQAPTSNVTTPKASTDGMTPGHLMSENLDPTLQSFEDTGVPATSGGTPTGELCGNVSAASLYQVAVPMALAVGGSNACNERYTNPGNSLLDVFVGGCSVTVFGFITVQAINPTQPDQQDPNVAAAGAGPPYTLVENSSHHVTSCKDKNGMTVSSLSACLADAAYSSFFKFSTDRVIVK